MIVERGFPQWLSDIEDRSARLRAAVGAAPSLDARVPGCPDWTLRDLAAHIGRVQRFWTAAVREGADRRGAEPAAEWGPPSRESIADPEPTEDLAGWLAASAAQLIGALAAAGPAAPCWRWWAAVAPSAPSTAGAVARHQAQEVAVHAYDALDALGAPQPLPTPIAVDGVGEFLDVMAGSSGPWPHPPAMVLLVARDGPSWLVRLDADGATARPSGQGEPQAVMRGTASDLVLALYGRIPLSAMDRTGDVLLRQLIDWPNTT